MRRVPNGTGFTELPLIVNLRSCDNRDTSLRSKNAESPADSGDLLLSIVPIPWFLI